MTADGPREGAKGHGAQGAGAQGEGAQTREDELREVEEEIEQLRHTVAALREQLGDLGGVTDPADHAAALTAVEEQEALLATLIARRDRLRQEGS